MKLECSVAPHCIFAGDIKFSFFGSENVNLWAGKNHELLFSSNLHQQEILKPCFHKFTMQMVARERTLTDAEYLFNSSYCRPHAFLVYGQNLFILTTLPPPSRSFLENSLPSALEICKGFISIIRNFKSLSCIFLGLLREFKMFHLD